MTRKSKKTFVTDTPKPAKKARISKSSSKKSKNSKSNSRQHIACDCNICKGSKVDPRTRQTHISERELPVRNELSDMVAGGSQINVLNVPMDLDEINISDSNSDNDDSRNEQEFNFLVTRPNKPKRQSQSSSRGGNRNIIYPIVLIEHVLNSLNSDEEENIDESDLDEDSDEELEDSSGKHVDFDAPEYDDNDEGAESSIPDINSGFAWIVYWIFKFQERYRLADTAIDSLIKFIRRMLMVVDKDTYSKFPTSLYMANKLFGISDQSIKYATCKKCCKLYAIKDLPTDIPYHCTFQDFPNHTMANLRSPCNAIITKQVPTNQKMMHRPSLIFPVANIKRRLRQLYNTKGFEESCRKWTIRPNNDQELADIFDGIIWKTFKDPNTDELFFRHEVSDSHLGIMLNLDWFQPFDNSQYSVGVLYAVICNLPRSERFKNCNIITLAIIPGPNEPKLHRLNHYLAPIIDQFISLWEGITIDKTYESSVGKFIRAAIICCACDIPAARKLCGHISARVACHRCRKLADFTIVNQPNFGGFDDMEQWFVSRDVEELKNNAL